MEQFVYRHVNIVQTFNDVVGQKAITNTLLNAIESNHLASALLFYRSWKMTILLEKSISRVMMILLKILL
jgi:hypothetical protein